MTREPTSDEVVINKSITLAAVHTDFWHHGNWRSAAQLDNSSNADWNNDYNDNASDGNVIIKAPTNLAAPGSANPDALIRVTGKGVTATILNFTIEGASPSGTPNLLFGVRTLSEQRRPA